MKDLRDWYSYLERSARASTGAAPAPPPAPEPAPSGSSATPRGLPARTRPRPDRSGRAARRGSGLQERLPFEVGGRVARRPGRPPLTETREEIIRRLLDPELSVHEAAALLNVSKATLRRYTDSGKLPCRRTAGGQRRFKLSAILALLDSGAGPARAS